MSKTHGHRIPAKHTRKYHSPTVDLLTIVTQHELATVSVLSNIQLPGVHTDERVTGYLHNSLFLIGRELYAYRPDVEKRLDPEVDGILLHIHEVCH